MSSADGSHDEGDGVAENSNRGVPLLSPKEARRRRAHLKKGLIRRLVGNAKAITAGVMIATAVFIGAATAEWMPAAGTTRPDCVEIFAGKSMVTQCFSRWGWSVVEPVDVLYGSDLREPEERQRLLDLSDWIERIRPRLVLVSYPCHLWSPLTNMQFSSPQAKRRLKKLRERETEREGERDAVLGVDGESFRRCPW